MYVHYLDVCVCVCSGDWYNFGNANDQLNYCPATEDVSLYIITIITTSTATTVLIILLIFIFIFVLGCLGFLFFYF